MLFLAVGSAAGGCQNNTLSLEDGGTGDLDSGSSTDITLDSGVPPSDTTSTTEPVPPPPMTTTPSPTTADSGPTPSLEDGWWLLALDTGSPGLPFQFLVFTTQSGPGVWDMSLQPLALDVGSTTTPRYPVGEPTFYPGVAYDEGVPLAFYTGQLTIPGEANPVNGTAVTIDAFLDGSDLGDPFCGPVSGAVVEPVQADLAGSTFATTRIPDPMTLPLEFPTTCP